MRTATANDFFTCCLLSTLSVERSTPATSQFQRFEDRRCLGMPACYLRDRQPLVNCGAAPRSSAVLLPHRQLWVLQFHGVP